MKIKATWPTTAIQHRKTKTAGLKPTKEIAKKIWQDNTINRRNNRKHERNKRSFCPKPKWLKTGGDRLLKSNYQEAAV